MNGSENTRGKLQKRGFDPVHAAWFFPFLVFVFLAVLRVLAPRVSELPELFWLDQAIRVRSELGFAEPLDPSIRFVELKMSEEIAHRFAEEGEYAAAAGILKTLAAMGAKVIAVDIIYTWGREEDQKLLADTIREIEAGGQTKVVLPISIEEPKSGTADPYILHSLPKGGGQFEFGFVNASPDYNWREYRFARTFHDETFFSLALAALSASRDVPLKPKVTGEGKVEWKTLGESGKIQTKQADDTRVFLNLQHSFYDDRYDEAFNSQPGVDDFRRVWSVEDLEKVAEKTEGTSVLYDTIVILGWDQEVDWKSTALSDQEPGMLLHATALNDLIKGTAIRPFPLWADLLLYGFVAAFAALSFSQSRKKRWLISIAILCVGLILVGGWLAVWFASMLPHAVNAAVLWTGAVVLEIGRRWTYEQRERTQRDAMLGFYFSPAVLKQVMKDLDMIRPQGTNFAILLSDMRGFTTFCETQPVARVFELLNCLFGIETEVALKYNGSLARFAGDQFLAYWGAPEPVEHAADRALKTALEIQEVLAEKRDAASSEDLESWLRIGIGLHYGRGLVGHVGSRSYRDYNLVGDSVNTTARVESQTKNYAAPILVTGSFMDALTERPPALLVDCVTVKGKSMPTELYAVLLLPDESILESCRKFENAFQLYRMGDFTNASAAFEVLTRDPFETVAVSARLLAERCHDLARQSPDDWAGIFELTSK